MVYQQIISDVVEASRVDFEEGGVDEGTLEDLRKVRPALRSRFQLYCSFEHVAVLFLFILQLFPSCLDVVAMFC